MHPFGAVSPPAVDNYILKRVGCADGLTSEVSRAIRQNFYVDNVLTSMETVEEARTLSRHMKDACANGGFNLTKFISTHPEALDLMKDEDKVEGKDRVDLAADGMCVEWVLGMVWSVKEDVFRFCIHPQ